MSEEGLFCPFDLLSMKLGDTLFTNVRDLPPYLEFVLHNILAKKNSCLIQERDYYTNPRQTLRL